MYCSSTTAKNIICNVWQPQILGLHIIWSVSGLAARQYANVAAMFQSCTYLQCSFNAVYSSVTHWSSATGTMRMSRVNVLWGCDGAKPLMHVPSMLLDGARTIMLNIFSHASLLQVDYEVCHDVLVSYLESFDTYANFK